MPDFLYNHRKYRRFVHMARVILSLVLLALQIIQKILDLF